MPMLNNVVYLFVKTTPSKLLQNPGISVERERMFRERERGVRENIFSGRANRTRVYGDKSRETSVFVYNLPYKLDKFGVAGIFKKAGRISDIYIPVHQNYKRSGRYGFVRFYSKEEAWRCIRSFHGGRIRGQKISVSLARPKKQGPGSRKNWARYQPKPATIKKEWRRKEKVDAHKLQMTNREDHQEQQNEKDLQQQQKEMQVYAVISGQRNGEVEEWLDRALVGTTAEPRDLATLTSAIMSGYSPEIKISAISCYQFLLVFPTVERMIEALDDQVELQQWFIEIRKWSMEIYCETRRVWLDVIGVPPQGWVWENFKQIAELWGRMICLGKSSTNTESFETMRVLVATKIMHRIEAVVLLQVGYGGYRVSIKEVGNISPMPSKINQYADGIQADDQLSNTEVPGFEDVDDNISIPEEGRLETIQNQNQKISNGTEDEEAESNNESRLHTLEKTRTKTVSFSQNANSEEVIKLQQSTREKEKAKGQDEALDTDSSPPPGFEFIKGRDCKNSCMRQAKGAVRSAAVNAGNLKSVTQQAISEETSNSSNSTSESLIRLAQDSLHIGELLGVRVTGNVAAAISRITSPLKKGRKQGKKGKFVTKD